MNRVLRTESGFVLPTAIFLLAILAALAAYMVSLSRTSHLSSALDIQGGRAYQAARAGMEWAAWQVGNFPVPPLNPVPTPCPLPFPGAVVLTGTLTSFNVAVTCTQTVVLDGATTVAIYQITSTATSGLAGEVDFVSRQIQGSFSK